MHSSDSLRFLFLDEANRLSPGNLGILFDLCQTLEPHPKKSLPKCEVILNFISERDTDASVRLHVAVPRRLS